MDDAYYSKPDELARFYAKKMAQGYGPAAERKLGWDIRDARNAGDRRRAEFWERVRQYVREYPAEHGRSLDRGG